MMTVDVLAVGPHPDDVELGCGGTLALLTRKKLKVGILHLTLGEAGTRGSSSDRRREAEQAAARLGVAELRFLDCGDGSFRRAEQEEEALIEELRSLRPELVLGPQPRDRHPDHERAFRLLKDCCFYAGLAARSGGPPFRPAALFSYMQHYAFEPSFIVDVSQVWELKEEALDAYQSQLHSPGRSLEGPVTKVASPDFRKAVEGRARHFGQLIGCSHGEPFWSPLPLAVSDPLSVLPGGLR